MADELKSFKVSQAQKQKAAPARPKVEQVEESPQKTLGFARIEKLLETETRQSIQDKMTDLRQTLSAFADQAGANKDKASAKQAIQAVDLCRDLVNYLFDTKAELEAGKTPSAQTFSAK